MEHIVVLNLAVGAAVALFSWRLSCLITDGAYLRYWGLYWAAASFGTVAATELARQSASAASEASYWFRTAAFLLMLPRPLLLAMAAASLLKPSSPRLAPAAGLGALLLAAGWMLAALTVPALRHPTRPAAGAFLIAALAALVFAAGVFRRESANRWRAALGSAVIAAYAFHLAAYGLTLGGIPIYPAWDSAAAAAVSGAVGALVAVGLGLTALDSAREARRRYVMIVEGTPVGIHFYCRAPGGGLLLSGANPAADSILGIAHSELIGQRIDEAFPALKTTTIPADYERVLETGVPIRREEINYSEGRISGAFDVVCFRLTPDSIAVMFNDITERKWAEEELRRSEARYRLITDNSTDMISVHSVDGAYQFVSPSSHALLGYEPGELIGRSAYDFIHPDDIAAVHVSHKSVLGQELPTIVYRIRRKDGSWVWVETTSRLAAPGDGGASSIIAATRDITRRRRLEEQFYSAQRLEEIGRLAGGVAHDFNNLLTVINGNAALMEADPLASPRSRQLALSIRQAGESATSLVRHLLAYARRQRLEPVRVQLNEIVSAAKPVLKRLAGEHIEVALDLCDDDSEILADPTQLHQVLLNLAVNAKEAMTGPGRITIATRRVAAPSESPSSADLPPGESVRLLFADNGHGMTEEVRKRAFEPFFSTKPQGQSSGLGLASVLGIIEQSNGSITVRSEPGRGTEFVIDFPAARQIGGAPGHD